jgi:hypothetical protein
MLKTVVILNAVKNLPNKKLPFEKYNNSIALLCGPLDTRKLLFLPWNPANLQSMTQFIKPTLNSASPKANIASPKMNCALV